VGGRRPTLAVLPARAGCTPSVKGRANTWPLHQGLRLRVTWIAQQGTVTVITLTPLEKSADVGADGHIIGTEVLDARERFGASVDSLVCERLQSPAGTAAGRRR
jgi:hypothetical protein